MKEILGILTSGPPEERPSVADACGGDPTLIRDVEELLAYGHEAETFLEGNPWESASGEAPKGDDGAGVAPRADGPNDTLPPGHRVGAYRIERLLDRGGMGVVYLARRADDFDQRVALKLVDFHLHTGDILDRFYRERQILADLEHPNIARLLDGGSTDQALPFFAMEFVEGQPIDRYCDDHGLSIEERLGLFRQVCEAVHFAHQSLVVHRDIKPSNILVTDEGVPKLLDFGIAKILAPDPSLPSGTTMPGRRPMTPGYASPEQLLDEPITTASDVYALGVLLYRLMSGEAPYRLQGASFLKMVELICHGEPPRPSTVVRRFPAVEDGPRRWRKLAGDIDGIVLKAMGKEPRQRYASALQLSEDVDRHLKGLPIAAREGTWWYVAGKFARRHTLALAMLGVIVGFAVAATVLWRQAVEERGRAELERSRAEAARSQAVDERAEADRSRLRAERVSSFLEELFEAADPDADGAAAVSAREILDRGRLKISQDLADQPEVRAELSGTLGTVYNNLGLYAEARELKEEGLRWRKEADGTDRPELAIDLNNLARLLYDLGDYSASEQRLHEALAIWRRLGDDGETATTLRNLAAVAIDRGRHAEALELHREALELSRGLYGPDHPKVAESLYNLGVLHFTSGSLDPAERLLRQALDIHVRARGPEHTRVVSALGSLGRVLHARGRLDEAGDYLSRALAQRRRLLGDGHPHVARAEASLAALRLDEGDTDAAGELLRRALATLRRVYGSDNWRLADAESVWGEYLNAVGRVDEGERYLFSSYRDLTRIKGPNDVYTRSALNRLVHALEGAGRSAEAEELQAAHRSAEEQGKGD
ncbi:MAG: serine/threonine-protein kinase [Acidobacteriota bacterium]